MIKLRHQQPSWWEGLFAEEVAELWEPWMRWWMSCWRMRNCWMWCMRRKGNGILTVARVGGARRRRKLPCAC